MPLDGTVVRQRKLHGALVGPAYFTENRKRLQRAYLDGLAGGHIHRSQGAGLKTLSTA